MRQSAEGGELKISVILKSIKIFLPFQIDTNLSTLDKLTEEYAFVSHKTSSLHLASENLIQEQNQLNGISEDIKTRLKYFMQVEHISQRLQNPTFTPSSDQFAEILNTIDDSIDYMKKNPNFKETAGYSMKYKQCLLKSVQMIKLYVIHILTVATEQVLTPKNSSTLSKMGKLKANFKFQLNFHEFSSRRHVIRSCLHSVLWKIPGLLCEN